MKRISDYRALARMSMRGSYGIGLTISIGIMLLQFALSALFSKAAGDSQFMQNVYSVLSLIISIIIVQPLYVGVTKFFLEQAQARPNMGNVFYAFKNNLTNTVKICFIRELKIFLWLMIPCALGMLVTLGIISTADAHTGGGIITELVNAFDSAAVFIVQAYMAEDPSVYVTTIMYVWSALIILMLPGIVKSLEYNMIDYILAENTDVSNKEAFKMTKKMMKGNKGRLFLLMLSFTGWIMLGMMFGGIGILFVIPYIYVAEAHFYIDVKCRAGYGQTNERNYDNIDDGDTFGL